MEQPALLRPEGVGARPGGLGGIRPGRLRGVTDVWVGVREGAEPLLGAALATARTPVELRAELAADTAAWRIPKILVTLSAFPTTARGKTDTAALRARVFVNRG